MDLVYLTGATGFVGGHVQRALLDAGYSVRALDRSSGDLESPGELARQIDGARYLVHVAALYSFAPRDRARMHRVNVSGTAGILEAAYHAGVERAVVTSSSATLGPARGNRPADESSYAPVGNAHSAYHHSKIEQERAALAARVPVTLVLPTAPVGPGDHKPTPTGQLVRDFARGRITVGPPSGGLNLVAVEDVARAHVLALQRGRMRERYVTGGENLSLDEIWSLLAEVSGRPLPHTHVPFAVALAAGYVDEVRCRLFPLARPFAPLEGVLMSKERMYVDSSKAMRELGYTPTPVRDALARAVAWYRQRGDA